MSPPLSGEVQSRAVFSGRAVLALTALVLKGLDPVDRACPASVGLNPVDLVFLVRFGGMRGLGRRRGPG